MSNAMAEAAEAQSLAIILVDQEARRVGCRILARERVARLVGVSPGTIENLQRARLKRISGWLRDALRARVIREIEAEIVRLQHELSVLRQSGEDPRSNKITAVASDLQKAMRAIGQ